MCVKADMHVVCEDVTLCDCGVVHIGVRVVAEWMRCVVCMSADVCVTDVRKFLLFL